MRVSAFWFKSFCCKSWCTVAVSLVLVQCVFLVNMAAPKIQDVKASTAWMSKRMPQHGLVCSLSFDYRVYVIECKPPSGKRGPFFYVGIEHKSQVGRRIIQHWQGQGSHFTRTHPPQELHMVWPATSTAVESYIFHLLLSTLPPGCVNQLGGWTQTSTNVSPLSSMVYEQERRLLRGACFNCGGSHFAASCPKPLEGVKYTCPGCANQLLISSRGQSVVAGAVAGAGSAKAKAAPLPPKPLAPQPTKRAAASSSASEPAAKVARVGEGSQMSGKVVHVCGKAYTSLSWFLGNPNPGPSLCEKARASCKTHALELDGGDARTLALQGFCAQPPLKPKDLLPDRQRLPSEWSDTACKSIRANKAVKLRKAQQSLDARLSKVLWLVSDLELAFKNKHK